MRSSWLYLATRSERDIDPVLICVALLATAMSAMVASSVSPERCETIAAYLAFAAMSIAAERLGQRADLVRLDEDRVGDFLGDAFGKYPGVGDEHIVAHELHLRAELPGEHRPAVPVALAHAVLDGDDGILRDQPGQIIGEFGRD